VAGPGKEGEARARAAPEGEGEARVGGAVRRRAVDDALVKEHGLGSARASLRRPHQPRVLAIYTRGSAF
jgi:hypothetical protein